MNLPDIVSREAWLIARQKLLLEEKKLTRARDALNAERRRLPMVKVDKNYLFESATGMATLLDLFESGKEAEDPRDSHVRHERRGDPEVLERASGLLGDPRDA